MNCEHLRDHYELYAIGLAEEPERGEIREHLEQGCEVCMAELTRARELAAILATTAPLADPPARLRERILAAAGVAPRRLGWWAPFWAVAAVCAIFAAAFFASREKDLGRELARNEDLVRRQTVELTRLNEAFAILSGPDTTEATFGGSQPQPPKGKVFVNPSEGVLLMASNLPPAASGKIYEMWIIPKKGMPVPAGLFQTAAEGTAFYVRRGAVDVNATGAVAVTLENAGGAPQPTSTPIIVAAIPTRG